MPVQAHRLVHNLLTGRRDAGVSVRAQMEQVWLLLQPRPHLIADIWKDDVLRELLLSNFSKSILQLIHFIRFVRQAAIVTLEKTYAQRVATEILTGIINPFMNETEEELGDAGVTFDAAPDREVFSDFLIVLLELFEGPANTNHIASELSAVFRWIATIPDVLETLCATVEGAACLKDFLFTPTGKYPKNSIRYLDKQTITAWNNKLIRMALGCGHDNAPKADQDWNAIQLLLSYFTMHPALNLEKEEIPTLRSVDFNILRKLTKEDKGTLSTYSSSGSKKQKFLIEIEDDKFELLNSLGLPEIKARAQILDTISHLEDSLSGAVLELLLEDFPCHPCTIKIKQGMKEVRSQILSVVKGNYEHKGIGLWRMVLSSQALKDLGVIQENGFFDAVQSKFIALASGDWGGKARGLKRKNFCADHAVPVQKAVYHTNGRILWSIDVVLDYERTCMTQVIKIWRIGDHKDVEKSMESIRKVMSTYKQPHIQACKKRYLDPIRQVLVPQTFDASIVDKRVEEMALTREECLELHQAVVTGKFYTLTQNVLNAMIEKGSDTEFPFDLSKAELDIIAHALTPTFILGRSGTGKTSCLVFRLLSRYLMKRSTVT